MSDLKRVRVVKREETEWEFQFPLKDKTILFVTVSTPLAANALRDMVDDAERYRWLSSQPGSYPALARFVVSAAGTAKHGFATPLDVYKAVDLDAAIDAAMKREGER